jgi:hypothetical protein
VADEYRTMILTAGLARLRQGELLPTSRGTDFDMALRAETRRESFAMGTS